MPRILLVCGSLRNGSTNEAVLRTALALAPSGVDLELYGGMASLPLFNPDDDPVEGEPPAPVAAFRRELAAADAILFSTPEYAGALPGPLVNLLDWTVGGGETYGMPVGFINAAGRAAPTAGKNAHDSLRTILGYTGSRLVEAACRRAPVARADVGADGLIVDPGIRAEITAALDALAATPLDPH
jgi:chromate reductase, NAD(P)H dehydrogenase (quinone)